MLRSSGGNCGPAEKYWQPTTGFIIIIIILIRTEGTVVR